MAKYKLNDIVKTLNKLFGYGFNTTEKVAMIKWQEIDSIGDFSPFEKSLIMDFVIVIGEYYKSNKKISQKGIIEFLSANIGGSDG